MPWPFLTSWVSGSEAWHREQDMLHDACLLRSADVSERRKAIESGSFNLCFMQYQWQWQPHIEPWSWWSPWQAICRHGPIRSTGGTQLEVTVICKLSDLADFGQLTPAKTKTMPRFNLCFVQYQWQQRIEPWSPWSLWRAVSRHCFADSAGHKSSVPCEAFSCLSCQPSWADAKSGQSCRVQIYEVKKPRAQAAVIKNVAIAIGCHWDGAKTCRDHFWHLGRVPQKHEIASRICCMMHVPCCQQMKGIRWVIWSTPVRHMQVTGKRQYILLQQIQPVCKPLEMSSQIRSFPL